MASNGCRRSKQLSSASGMIESTCTKCHSPMGYTQAIYNGQSGYSMAELKQDPLRKRWS